MANIARMRTCKQCVEYFRKEDPETSISEYYIRSLVRTRSIPVFKTGAKFLVNLDKLIEYLNNDSEEEQVTIDFGKIRQLRE